MNLLPVMRTFKRQIPAWGSWFFTTDIRPIAGFASAHRLMLMGFFHTAVSKSRIAFLVTTEQEALEELARTRPGLLFVVDQLEQGSSLALVEQARSVVPDIRSKVLNRESRQRFFLEFQPTLHTQFHCFRPGSSLRKSAPQSLQALQITGPRKRLHPFFFDH